jgi:hypothetical protein
VAAGMAGSEATIHGAVAKTEMTTGIMMPIKTSLCATIFSLQYRITCPTASLI